MVDGVFTLPISGCPRRFSAIRLVPCGLLACLIVLHGTPSLSQTPSPLRLFAPDVHKVPSGEAEGSFSGLYPPNLDGPVLATTEFNDALYVSGSFITCPVGWGALIARYANGVWDNTFGGVEAYVGTPAVRVLTIFNDELYLGGAFLSCGGVYDSPNIVRFDGDIWNGVGMGVGAGSVNTGVFAVEPVDSCIFVGGDFQDAGGSYITGIARWSGDTWQPLGTGTNGPVRSICSFDGGIVCGGTFTVAGGMAANSIAFWNGTTWLPMADGIAGHVWAITVFEDEVFVGGTFLSAGVIPTTNIAKWTGSDWVSVGGANDAVYTIESIGGSLYVGGAFTNLGGESISRIAKWEEGSWTGLGGGADRDVRAIGTHSGSLVMGGNFIHGGDVSATRIAEWAGSQWSPLTSGLDATVSALCVYDGALAIGGAFETAGDTTAQHIVFWDRIAWRPLSGGVARSVNPYTQGEQGNVSVLLDHDGALFAAGDFTMAGGAPANRIARWDGAGWSPLSSGMDGSIHALATFDSKLIAAGSFSSAGGVSANRIAAWDGGTWAPLSSGTSSIVYALCSCDSVLYVGGEFDAAGGSPSKNLAVWDGVEWHSMVSEMSGIRGVRALAEYGGDLYVAGGFNAVDGMSLEGIGRWDGMSWHAVGQGLNSVVYALATYDGELYAGGDFFNVGPDYANRIARWDGASWRSVSIGISYDKVYALCPYDSSLFIGGYFAEAGGKPSGYIAEWRKDVLTAVQLMDYGAGWGDNAIDIWWRLAENSDEARDVRVLRRSAVGGAFEEVTGALVSRDGLKYHVEDADVRQSGEYVYRVEIYASDRTSAASFQVNAQVPAIPLRLYANYPNPIRGETVLRFDLPESGRARIDLYDVAGRRVETVFAAPLGLGTHRFTHYPDVPAGVYFYRLTFKGHTASQKTVIVR